MAVHRRGAGPDVVLFHGGMGSWKHWIRNVDALATRIGKRPDVQHAVDARGQQALTARVERQVDDPVGQPEPERERDGLDVSGPRGLRRGLDRGRLRGGRGRGSEVHPEPADRDRTAVGKACQLHLPVLRRHQGEQPAAGGQDL